MSSDSEKDCQVIETKILSDAKWFKSLDDSERQLLEKNKIPFEELEDKKVVCTACFKQGNHKQTVSIPASLIENWSFINKHYYFRVFLSDILI